MKSPPRLILRTACLACLVMAAAPVCGEVTDDQIDAAIEAGIANVWANQLPDGRWGQYDWAGGHHFPWGRDAIAMLTLEFADTQIDEPRFQKGLKQLLEAELEYTYERSCRTMVLAHLTRRTKGDPQAGYRKALIEDTKWLEEAQGQHGGWTYVNLHGGPGIHDFSNSQMAVLALSEAIMSGVEVSPAVMRKAQELFLKAQREDGGWNYRLGDTKDESYGSMTAAAVATLFITRDYLTPQVGCPCRSGRSPRRRSAADQAIEAGVKWLEERFVPDNNPGYHTRWWVRYWLYSVARVGVATGYKYLGTHNWYREGADFACQSTRLGGRNFPYACLATLFLIKGKAPLLFNKLQWDGEWNLHPRDMANLTRHISREKEQPVNWQAIPVTAPLEEWHEAPVLYISAEEKIDFTEDQKEKLRRFTETGGTIFFEATCGNRTAEAWWRNLSKELWPQFEFQRLDNEHALWSADLKIGGRKPVLYGLADGLRTFVLLAPLDISCTWNTEAAARHLSTFQVGNNIYMYAADRNPIRAVLARKPQAPAAYRSANVSPGAKSTLRIARLKSSGDYYVGERYSPLEVYNARRNSGAPELTVAEPLSAGEAMANGIEVLWLTGRQKADVPEEDAKALRDFLSAGGFLFAEATMGDERFRKSFAEFARRAGLEIKVADAREGLVTGQLGTASGYDVSKVSYTTHLKGRRVGQSAPVLEGIYLGEQLVGVLSPYDVTFSQTGCKAFGNLGYDANDARAILTNILLLASCRKTGDKPND